MEATRGIEPVRPALRHFRDADDESGDGPVREIEEICLKTNLPLEVNMTDEPGGDPYNHTGRFRRNFR
jgi:hypothetical protein